MLLCVNSQCNSPHKWMGPSNGGGHSIAPIHFFFSSSSFLCPIQRAPIQTDGLRVCASFITTHASFLFFLFFFRFSFTSCSINHSTRLSLSPLDAPLDLPFLLPSMFIERSTSGRGGGGRKIRRRRCLCCTADGPIDCDTGHSIRADLFLWWGAQ
jgi:hypothetical protein